MATVSPAQELRDLDGATLVGKLREAKEELFNLRFQSATGQLESHGRLKSTKHDIARIYTVLRERELGITAAPPAAVEPVATEPAVAADAEAPAVTDGPAVPAATAPADTTAPTGGAA